MGDGHVIVSSSGPPNVTTHASGGSAVATPSAGPQGPKGDPGAGVLSFTQSTPAATWVVTHNLGRAPIVGGVIVGGEYVFANLVQVDSNTLNVVFASPQSGVLMYS